MPRLNPFARTSISLERLWQAEIGDCVIGLAWSPDGTLLAAASVSGPIHVFDTATGKQNQLLSGHSFGTTAIGFSASGKHFASTGQDGHARLWDVKAGKEFKKLHGGASWVERLAWCGAEDVLATAAGKKLRLWNADGELIREYADHPSTIADMQWKPGEAILASCAYEVVCLWSPVQQQEVQRYLWKGSHLALAWSPDGKHLASGDQDSTVHFWIMKSGEDLQMSGYPTKVRELSWDYTSRYLATGGSSVPCIWDCAGAGPAGTRPIQLEAHADLVAALAYQHDGPYLASAGQDGLLALWHPAKQQGALALAKLPAGLTQLAWAPKDLQVAVGTDQGGVALFMVRA